MERRKQCCSKFYCWIQKKIPHGNGGLLTLKTTNMKNLLALITNAKNYCSDV